MSRQFAGELEERREAGPQPSSPRRTASLAEALRNAVSACPAAKRASLSLLVLILCGGVAARCFEIAKRSFWYDELYSVVGAATSSSWAALSQNWINVDGHPFGYITLLYGWFQLVPATERWARIPSAVISLATLAYLLFARTGRLSLSARTYAAALYAASYGAIYDAQTSRHYGLLISCGLAANLHFVEIAARGSARLWVYVRLVVLLLIAAYVHYLGIMLAGAVLGLLTLTAWLRRRERWQPLAAAAAFLVAYLPGFYYLRRTVELNVAGWQQNEPVWSTLTKLLDRVFFGSMQLLLPFAALALLLPWLATRRERRLRLRAITQDRALASLLCLLLGHGAALAMLAQLGPFIQTRYTAVLFGPLLLSCALWLSAALPIVGWRGTVALSGILIAGMLGYRDYRDKPKQEWRQSAQLVIKQQQPGDAVFILGEDPNQHPLAYLRAGDVDGYIYCRDLPFYQFYFKRLGAGQLADRLQPLPRATKDLVRTLRKNPTERAYVLAPHHTRIPDDAIKALRRAKLKLEKHEYFSTTVYEVTRKSG